MALAALPYEVSGHPRRRAEITLWIKGERGTDGRARHGRARGQCRPGGEAAHVPQRPGGDGLGVGDARGVGGEEVGEIDGRAVDGAGKERKEAHDDGAGEEDEGDGPKDGTCMGTISCGWHWEFIARTYALPL